MKVRTLFILLISIILSLCLAGCDIIPSGSEDDNHEHTGGIATCLKRAICDICGKGYGDKAEHDYSEATCTSPEVCKVCRSIKGEPLGHDYSILTCTEDSVCNRCGEENETASGHKYGEWTTDKAASCTDDGQKSRSCSTCGTTETSVIAAYGHTYEECEITKEPTCEAEGEKLEACKCGSVLKSSIEATGHSFSTLTVTKAATCTENGEKTGACKLCSKSTVIVIKATGHSYGEWTTVKNPTYSEVGTKIRTCHCGNTESAEIPCLELLFEDDFSGDTLDSSKWDDCPEWDRQGGSSRWDDGLSYLDGEGHLVLKAEWDADNGRVLCGAVRTYGLFEAGYGYYEASIKFPVAKGTWGAFWINCGNITNVDGSAADGVEIDVVESIYNEKGVFNSALHYDGYGDAHVQVHSGYLSTVNIYDGGFHTFAVERTDSAYIFYVDGIETWRVDADECAPCGEMGFMKLTLEAAEWAGSGSEECIDALPAEMLVDYVRVYSENPYK